MSTAAINTKIERVCEAVEDLAVAVAAGVTGRGKPSDEGNVRSYEAVKEARAELGTALREFLQPTLRVVGAHGSPLSGHE